MPDELTKKPRNTSGLKRGGDHYRPGRPAKLLEHEKKRTRQIGLTDAEHVACLEWLQAYRGERINGTMR